MTINIGEKFIQKGSFKASCPECKKDLDVQIKGELESVKCSCGYVFLQSNTNDL